MITFDTAKQFAYDKLLGSNLVIDETIIIERHFGWFFGVSENHGCGGIIVDRENGHVFLLGSAYSLERDFAAYEAGFKYDYYDLSILSVHNFSKTVDLLLQLNMVYVIPEEENGTIWKIHQRYSREQIEALLKNLPCTFSDQKFYFHFETFQEIDKISCCRYQTKGYYLDISK